VGVDVIRRFHRRLLTVGPCRGPITARLILALTGLSPGYGSAFPTMPKQSRGEAPPALHCHWDAFFRNAK